MEYIEAKNSLKDKVSRYYSNLRQKKSILKF